jgi:hypothetical protein
VSTKFDDVEVEVSEVIVDSDSVEVEVSELIVDFNDVEIVEVAIEWLDCCDAVGVVTVAVRTTLVSVASDGIGWDKVGVAVTVGTTSDVKVGSRVERTASFETHTVDT